MMASKKENRQDRRKEAAISTEEILETTKRMIKENQISRQDLRKTLAQLSR